MTKNNAVNAAEALLRIRKAMAAGEPISTEDARYFVAAIDEWLSGTEFAVSFGVKPAAGEADPRRIIAENRRDELIRIAARKFFEHVPAARCAEELHRAWTRYFSTAWQTTDRKLIDCPARYAGRLEGLLFQITSLRPHVLSKRQIRRILAVPPPGFAAKESCLESWVDCRDEEVALSRFRSLERCASPLNIPSPTISQVEMEETT
jgi:hypothetical protein